MTSTILMFNFWHNRCFYFHGPASEIRPAIPIEPNELSLLSGTGKIAVRLQPN